MNDLRPAPHAVLSVVERQIAAHFPQLANARLVVLVRDKAVDVGGGKVSVAAAGVNGSDASLPFEYVIWVAWDVWQIISDGDRDALVFHELFHCGRDEAGRPELTPHDSSVFTQEVELYGAWWANAQKRFKARNNPEGGEKEV